MAKKEIPFTGNQLFHRHLLYTKQYITILYITYNFNEQGLYDIELDIFPKSDVDTKALFGQFKGYYDKRYGTSSAEDGYTTWFAQSHQGTDVEITMIDESIEMNKPYLSISFYEHSVND